VPIVAPEPVLGPQAASSAAPQKPEPNQPLIAVGLRLCESAESVDVRLWFDGLMPGSRIELLTLLQANIAGGSVPGAQEPGSARPLAQALGLLAA